MDNLELKTVIYAMLAIAIVGHGSLAFWYSGLQNRAVDLIEDLDDVVTIDSSVSIPGLHEGDMTISSYNMSLLISTESTERGIERGEYSIVGLMNKHYAGNRFDQMLSGTYSLLYYSNTSEDLSYSGRLHRTRNLSIDRDGIPSSHETHTKLTPLDPSVGSGLTTEIRTSSNQIPDVWTSSIWMSILDRVSVFNSTSGGEHATSLSLESIGLKMSSALISWRVNSIDLVDGIRTAFIKGAIEGGGVMSSDFELVFMDGLPFPERFKMEITAGYTTGDGEPVDLDLIIREDRSEQITGDGGSIPWFEIDPSDDVAEAGTEIDVVPMEGDPDNLFRLTPEECLEFAMKESPSLVNFIDTHSRGSVSGSRLRYYLNDTKRGSPLQVWNITLTASSQNSIHESYTFEVGIPLSGSVLERNKMTLISEGRSHRFVNPDPGRRIISLSQEEDVLRSTEGMDDFFLGEMYTPKYRLDIISRGEEGSGTLESLIYSMLGMERMHSRDLFISQVQDLSEKTLHVAVVDGVSGTLMYTMEATGPGVLLLNAYGIDPA
ncbi:MAG: hypothetical protein ACMUIG_05105 [Thermoplasmatota archaeon]